MPGPRREETRTRAQACAPWSCSVRCEEERSGRRGEDGLGAPGGKDVERDEGGLGLDGKAARKVEGALDAHAVEPSHQGGVARGKARFGRLENGEIFGVGKAGEEDVGGDFRGGRGG